MTRSNVVVTGIGIAAPNGLGTDEYWEAVLAGRSGIGPVRRFDASGYPATLAGEVSGFDAEEHLPNRLMAQTDTVTRLALAVTDWALEDAGVRATEDTAYDMGVITASSAGGFEFGHRELEKLWSKGGQFVSAYQSFAWFYAVNTGQISIRNQLKGPSSVVVTDQAGGLDALGQGRRQVRKGSNVIVSGGVDGSLCPWGWTALLKGGRISVCDRSEEAYLPFDSRARGHVVAEGGAILVLENAEGARLRDTPRVYGEIAGYSATFDPEPGQGRGPTLRRAIENALRDADVKASDVDVVFADAAATPELDRVEAEAITSVFGEWGVPVTAPKSMTGRMYAGAGALDVATALLTIREGVIPPTVGVVPDPAFHLDLVVDRPRDARVGTALVLARGQGGFNSAIVVRAPSEPGAETVRQEEKNDG